MGRLDFERFAAEHRDLMFAVAEANTPRDENGRAVIECDDSWRDETEWDEYARKVDAAVRV